MNLVRHIQDTLRRRRLLAAGGPVVAAVSGGVDSMVLLRVLSRLAPAWGWRLYAAHFNHGLRGDAADADQALVASQAAAAGCAGFISERGDVAGLAAREKISIEMAARRLRHAFLARAARQTGAGVIALGHHAGDQAELFFLRLIRGAGSGGISGMRWEGPSPADPLARLARPLLDVPRAELERFAREEGVPFREDESNQSRDMLRNRVRHDVLPWLAERFNASVVPPVCRTMEILGDESDYLDAAARQWMEAGGVAAWESLHAAVQRRVVCRQLTELGVWPEFEWVELLRLNAGTPVQVAPGRRIERTAAGWLAEVSPGTLEFAPGELAVDLSAGRGRVEFGGVEAGFEVVDGGGWNGMAKVPGEEWFDAEKTGDRLVLRHWREGDIFQPLGLAGPAKLQDLFVNAKVPQAQRRLRVLAQDARGRIFWVEGLRPGEAFKLGAGTRRRLRWVWRRGRMEVAPRAGP